jgi:glucose/mannose-6-phosphate isomerase
VTSGGELASRARADGVPVLEIPAGSPPRAALGWTSVPLLHALGRAGLLDLARPALDEAAAACEEVVAAHGPQAPPGSLREWAGRAARGLPIIHASESPHRASAVRWACQINENGKTLAHFAVFPEQNHNEIVSWEMPTDAQRNVELAILDDPADHPRVRRRLELVARIVERAGARVTRFPSHGTGLLARLYSFSQQADLASLCVAAARSVDPSPVARIDELKRALARNGG